MKKSALDCEIYFFREAVLLMRSTQCEVLEWCTTRFLLSCLCFKGTTLRWFIWDIMYRVPLYQPKPSFEWWETARFCGFVFFKACTWIMWAPFPFGLLLGFLPIGCLEVSWGCSEMAVGEPLRWRSRPGVRGTLAHFWLLKRSLEACYWPELPW